ncbi:MAG TPA: hypothetical protein VHZ01_08845 [Casimicrobiaceae bacterium]|jgi:hypothetical protein|nr:hypothetical protein [Casimicrobiaceae bacterium]
MPESTTSPRVSRRTLLKAGIAGGAALVLARWLYTSTAAPQSTPALPGALDAGARGIVAAIAPVMLAGALPASDPASLQEVVAGVEQAIAGLPPAVRKEIEQLFALLSFAPTRAVVAGVWSPWPDAAPASIGAFLDRWRDSRFALLRSAYGALHQLVFAAWYGNLSAWPAIGYPGPPSLEIG